jgi:hypothetical protein
MCLIGKNDLCCACGRAFFAQRTYKATLCKVASARFCGGCFCFVLMAGSSFIFFLVLSLPKYQKNKCAARVPAAKTMTRRAGAKTDGAAEAWAKKSRR